MTTTHSSLADYRLTVAVVTDEKAMQGRICEFLAARGVAAMAAESADDIPSVDVVLLDCRAGCDQESLARLAAGRGSPSILSLSSDPDEARPKNHIFEGTLPIPFRGSDLSRELERIAKSRAGLQRAAAAIDTLSVSRFSRAHSELHNTVAERAEVLATGCHDVITCPGAVACTKPCGVPQDEERRPLFKTDFAESGTLALTPTPALLIKILANRLTGILEIGRGETARSIYFVRGEPVEAESSAADESLASTVVKLGLVSLSELRAFDKKKLNDAALVEAQLITVEQLAEAVDRQVRERILSTFRYRDEPYVFRQGSTWMDRVCPRRQNPIELLLEGTRRHVSQNEMARALAGHEGDVVVRTERFGDFQRYLTDLPVGPFLTAIDGRKTLTQVVTENHARASEALHFVYSLMTAKMVKFVRPSQYEPTLAQVSTVPPSSATRRVPRPELAGPPESDMAVGALVAGRYRIEAPIGIGATSTVYRALDLELEEGVALKVLTLEAVSPDTLPRFKQELVIARKLAHRNVVRVYDIGTTSRGQKFISMELLEGECLRDRMTAPMPLADVCGILIQACRGLAMAHANGVIHRDIKPENLFMHTDGSVKVMDFGIAKKSDTKTTRIGFCAGTPVYMSPEQIEIFSSVTPRSDLYSLGIVAYEMLEGHAPFDDPRVEPVLRKHLEAPVPKMSRVPPEVEEVVLQLLEKDPDRRIQSCEELAELLEELAHSF